MTGHAIARLERTRSREQRRRAVCSCGSTTAWHSTAAAAIREFRQHAGIGEPARG